MVAGLPKAVDCVRLAHHKRYFFSFLIGLKSSPRPALLDLLMTTRSALQALATNRAYQRFHLSLRVERTNQVLQSIAASCVGRGR